jgi:hypothetical protein
LIQKIQEKIPVSIPRIFWKTRRKSDHICPIFTSSENICSYYCRNCTHAQK